jgi:type IV pilus assembly protein PilB
VAGAAKPRLGELLVGAGLLGQGELDEVLRTKDPGQKLGRALVERGLVTEQQLTQALSQLLSVPWVSLYHIDFSKALLARVSRDLVERYGLVPIFVRNVRGQGETLYVATDDPTNDLALAAVSRASGLPTRPMIASTSDIQAIIRVHYTNPGALPAVPVILDEPAVTVQEGRRVKPQEPPPKPPVKATQARTPAAPLPSPPPVSAVPVTKPEGGRRGSRGKKAPAIALTLLDGTQILLPSAKPPDEATITARDILSALRARAHGADATEILGADPKWESYVVALISLLLRKGLVSERELVDELSKI